MKRHIIYLTTNANRAYIEIGYCKHTDLASAGICQENLSFFYTPRTNRIVYIEEFHSFEEAERRKSELSTYTHMMKERLIRRYNPNWLNITNGAVTANIVNRSGLVYI